MSMLDKIKIELYGASHQKNIGFRLSGIEKGFLIDTVLIDELLIKRKGNIKYNTSRNKLEQYEFISGIHKNITTGEVIHLYIEQNDFNSNSYEKGIVRPSHADISAYIKYKEEYEYQGGGQFSGKMTVLYVIVGEIARQILLQMDIEIAGYYNISKVLNYEDVLSLNKTKKEFAELSKYELPVFNPKVRNNIIELLSELKERNESLGAKLSFKFWNIPAGLGEFFLESFESKLSAMIFSVPAVKSIEFGIGNEFSNKYGSDVLEQLTAESGIVTSETNFNGGINGGITNGFQPLYFSCTIKPSATLLNREIKTVKFSAGKFENVAYNFKGRHDAFIANRAAYPIMAMVYITVLDCLKSQ